MKDNSFFVILHNIRSLYNVGSIFRSADAFGVDKIFLTGYTGTPNNHRLKKTALGAQNSVPWEYIRQLKRVLAKLKQKKINIVALENNVTPHPALSPKRGEEGSRAASNKREKQILITLTKFKPKFPLAILLGEEVKGTKIRFLEMCNQIVEIPMSGQKESLNVAVAFGIAANHISQFNSLTR